MRRYATVAILVHVVRVAIVVALLALLPSPRPAVHIGETVQAPDLSVVRSVLSAAASVKRSVGEGRLWDVFDASGRRLARAARTLPDAEGVVGYRGPSEALVVVDDDFHLIGVRLIASEDTQEHVAAVRDDASFFDQFRSWTWGGPPDGGSIDAVSGATLTSLALAEGVLKRIGGDVPSLVFPDPVRSEEVAGWFPDAAELVDQGYAVIVLDSSGEVLGKVIRTGPLEDGVVGYQGPSELLINLKAGDARIDDLKLRASFDNQPYVRYCKTEYSFWPLFEGKTISELGAMDLQAAGVEGVSGATMTSMAIAETLVSAAQEYRQRETDRRETVRRNERTFGQRFAEGGLREFGIRLTAADLACGLVLLAIPVFRRQGWFRKRFARAGWLLAVIVVIGFWSGNLISMALIAGWSTEGIAWRLAPALAAVAAIAFLSPATAKANPYCSHVCPHGAIQQLIRPSRSSKRHRTIPRAMARLLIGLPGSLLVLAYLMLQFNASADLASWEPFHAYLFRIAPWSAIVLALCTLVFAAFVPLGYCRYGCPTGRLLDHLRRSSASGRLRWADGVALMLLAVAVARRLWD